MSLDLHQASSPDPMLYNDLGLQPNWGERAIVVVATSLAVLIVATITVLMGMA